MVIMLYVFIVGILYALISSIMMTYAFNFAAEIRPLWLSCFVISCVFIVILYSGLLLAKLIN